MKTMRMTTVFLALVAVVLATAFTSLWISGYRGPAAKQTDPISEETKKNLRSFKKAFNKAIAAEGGCHYS